MYRLARTLLFLGVLCTPINSLLAVNQFDNGSANVLDVASEDVVVLNGPADAATTLLIQAGAAITANDDGRAVGLFGNSVATFQGGEAAGTFQVNDNAFASISGGTIGEDLEINGGEVALSGEGYVDDDVFLNAGTFAMTVGGTVNDQFFAVGSSSVTLTSEAGAINDDLFIQDTAMLDMAGAALGDELFVQGQATATITGGYIDDDLNANDQAVINVSFVEIDDSVDTSGTGLVNFNDGIVNGGFEAAGSSTINIVGGTFENILSDGEVVLAAGGTINITGGTFGTPGVDDGGSIGASLGGTVLMTGGEIAGLAEGTAPVATLNAVLNGTTEISDVAFGPLVLEAGNNGTIIADDFTATSVAANSLANGEVLIVGGEADSLTIAAELGGNVELSGGSFADITATLNSESQLTIIGENFTYNGIPIENVDAQLGDTGAFIEETGELRLVAGEIAGVLADGSPFSMTYSREFIPAPGASVFLQPIPEPSGFALAIPAVLLSLSFRRRNRRRK